MDIEEGINTECEGLLGSNLDILMELVKSSFYSIYLLTTTLAFLSCSVRGLPSKLDDSTHQQKGSPKGCVHFILLFSFYEYTQLYFCTHEYTQPFFCTHECKKMAMCTQIYEFMSMSTHSCFFALMSTHNRKTHEYTQLSPYLII